MGTKYKQYGPYIIPLEDAFGQHCSYCERIDKLDVEHVIPKSSKVGKNLITTWDNLLLGCPRCNRDFKRAINTSRVGYVWPDQHNTFNCFRYLDDGRVKVRGGLPQCLAYKATKTLKLLRLDDGKQNQQALNLYRQGQFKIAKTYKRNYIAGHQTIDEIVTAAQFSWSVWMTVFLDISNVVNALKQQAIKGTNTQFNYL
jgi:uncharacterized protein (TIGR02646 family)